jgi:opacity protein-like surface antigen
MTLKRVVLTQVACLLLVGIMPSAAGAQTSPPGLYDWNGPYVGLQGGYGWGHSTQTDPGLPPAPPPPPPPPPPPDDELGAGSHRVAGPFVGLTAGHNWQIGRWLFGIEGDYSWSDIHGSLATCGTGMPHECGARLNSFGTLRARIGYASGMSGDWLPYLTGGLAVGDIHAWDALTPASGNKFRAGWTVGAGVEKALARNWTVKAEYLYMDFGSAEYFNIVTTPAIVPETVSFRASIFRLGANYRF